MPQEITSPMPTVAVKYQMESGAPYGVWCTIDDAKNLRNNKDIG